MSITRLVLTGIATSGVVLSTLREAADRDYLLTVLADGCADADPQVHQLLLEKIFPRQADVLTCAEWTSQLQASPARHNTVGQPATPGRQHPGDEPGRRERPHGDRLRK